MNLLSDVLINSSTPWWFVERRLGRFSSDFEFRGATVLLEVAGKNIFGIFHLKPHPFVSRRFPAEKFSHKNMLFAVTIEQAKLNFMH